MRMKVVQVRERRSDNMFVFIIGYACDYKMERGERKCDKKSQEKER